MSQGHVHQAGNSRTFVDEPNFTITWEMTDQLLCCFPWLPDMSSHFVLRVPTVPDHIEIVLTAHYTVGDNTVCLSN